MSYNYLPGRSESLSLLTSGQLSFNFWAGEILLGALVPAIILLVPRLRSQLPLQLLALALVIGGVAAYRWDTNMAGQLVVLTYLPQEIAARYTSYFPSLIEIAAGAGVVAYGVLAVSLGVRYLNLVDHGVAPAAEEAVESLPAPAAAD
jgi:molybdopterin-containing oxidoreductase family membrane subunit